MPGSSVCCKAGVCKVGKMYFGRLWILKMHVIRLIGMVCGPGQCGRC